MIIDLFLVEQALCSTSYQLERKSCKIVVLIARVRCDK